jgi:predicted nucleic acid-binding protein
MKPVVFVDTDVTLDLLLARHPFVNEAKSLFVLIETGKVEACSTPIIFANIFYLLRKQHPAETVKVILKDLRQLFTILPVDDTIVDQALASPFSDFEDALQYHAALTKGVSAIITRNTRDFRNAAIPVMTAGEFLASLDS